MFLPCSFSINIFVISITIFVTLYFYLTRNFDYWKSRGVKGPKLIPLLGTGYENLFTPKTDLQIEHRKKYGKITGLYFGRQPFLVVCDPQLIKEINIKDFNIFVNRNNRVTGDPFRDRNLFNLNGEEWKKMRSIISPTFSGGKMRRMHPIIVECVERLDQFIKKKAKNKEEIDLKNVMSNLTIDSIATSAFATKINIYDEENTSEFVSMIKKIFRFTWRVLVTAFVGQFSTKLLKWLKISFFDPNVSNFFKSAIDTIILKRKAEKGTYNDYLQLLINAKNKKSQFEEEDIEDEKTQQLFGQPNETNIPRAQFDITDDEIVANTLLFFFAGYETTSSLLSHFFYCLALNEKCQQKLYEEIKQFNGDFNYENITKMPYLESCVAETLRMYSPLPFVSRMASEDYKLGDTGITLAKGMSVGFNIHAIHYNPEYYPNPNRWDPQRFMPENRNKLIPNTYMPFGTGPRNCVGMRFALMEAKTAIAHLVNKYEVFRTENTTVPLKSNRFGFLLNTGDLKVGIKDRNE